MLWAPFSPCGVNPNCLLDQERRASLMYMKSRRMPLPLQKPPDPHDPHPLYPNPLPHRPRLVRELGASPLLVFWVVAVVGGDVLVGNGVLVDARSVDCCAFPFPFLLFHCLPLLEAPAPV